MTNPRTITQRMPILDCWYKTFVYLPRLSIKKKLVWGHCYKYTWQGIGGLTEGRILDSIYAATEKDVFEYKLRNEPK